MDDKFDPRIVFEDARHRHAAVVALIGATDAQAMRLLRLYVTIGIAAAAGAVGALSTPSPSVPAPVGWALVGVVACLMAGSYWCFKTMDTTPISLPGRKADFWLWALDPQIATVDALRAYLENLQAKTAQNDALNADIVMMMKRAKVAGMCAPLAAIGGAFVPVIVRAV